MPNVMISLETTLTNMRMKEGIDIINYSYKLQTEDMAVAL